MSLNLKSVLSDNYNSKSQKIRVLTESWVGANIYCPSCGNSINEYENNRPVADFYCKKCKEDFELKSKSGKIGKKIVDGAYDTMISRLTSKKNPNFFFLTYNKNSLDILNFIVIPKHFFTPEIIQKRKPLSPNAKRAGWVGCNILLDTIPNSGKLFYIKDGTKLSKNKILEQWHKFNFLQNFSNIEAKGWLLDIIKCVELLNKETFTLQELYSFEKYLYTKYPKNNNIKAKIRQQLQILRDKGYLKFISRGLYKLKE
jgi:type II restriction enzyme